MYHYEIVRSNSRLLIEFHQETENNKLRNELGDFIHGKKVKLGETGYYLTSKKWSGTKGIRVRVDIDITTGHANEDTNKLIHDAMHGLIVVTHQFITERIGGNATPLAKPRTIEQEIKAAHEEADYSYMIINTIIYGPPGTGKTHALTALTLSIIDPQQTSCKSYAHSIINGTNLSASGVDYANWHTSLQNHLHKGRVEFTTFHQNYAYEDFVEGLKAKLEGTTVHYTIEPGILKRMAYRALYAWVTGKESGPELSEDQLATVKGFLAGETPLAPEPESIPTYVLIIDEINRGNVARIFGELITLVEDSKRACRDITPGAQPVFATLPYTKERFILPPNLHIIGTMNTADRSLIGLDAALRRRFDFIELSPDPKLLSDNVGGVDLSSFLSQLNARIESEDTRDHCIGHAYFMAAESIEDIAEVMRRKVIPQLQEYFHDQPKKLSKLLTSGEGSFVDGSGRINQVMLKRAESYNNFGGA